VVRRKLGSLGAEPPALGDFGGFTTKIIHFGHILDEILPKTFETYSLWYASVLKRALNPNFLNLTINREEFWL